MANVIQQKFGTATPASDSLAKGELAIRFVAANHTASSSSKLFFGEGDSANLRQFGFGITDGSTQSGVAIGENLTFAASGNATVSVSGQTVTIGASGAGSVTGPIDFPTNSAATFDNTNNNSQTFIRNGGSNGASLQLGVGSPGNENTKIHMADDGDVGIGTVSPGSKLDIVSTSDNNTAGIRIGDGTNFAALYTDSGENFIIDPTNDFIVTGADDIKLQSSDDFELIADDFYFKNDADDSTMMRITSDGNVGIGTTSPNSKLTVQGDLDIPVGSRFRAGSGASGVNTGVDIYYNSDSSSTHHTDSMIETRSAGGDLVFRNLDNGQGYQFYANDAGGTENFIMGIDGANQRVGIGTTSPLQPLHVSSDENHLATFKSTDSIAEIRLQDNAAFTRLLSVSSKLKLMPNDGVELMVLDGSAEKVGIGTDSPVANLHISDSDSADVNLMLSNSNTGHTINDGFQFAVDTSKHAYIINRETADLKFYTSNAQRMVVDSTGNVGIDATSPSYKLTLGDRFMWDGNHFRANKTFAASMRNEDPSSTNPVFTFDGDLDTGMSRAAADELSLITGGTEAIRIDSSQRVGIGTDSPTSAVHLASATASEPVVTIENTNADGTPPGLTFFKNTTSPATEDQVGSIKFDSKEETSGDTKTYWEIQTRINDATNTTPNGQLNFYGLDGDSPGFIHQFQFINSQFSVLDSNGVGPTLSTYDTNGGQLKTTGTKLRLQAKSDSTGEIHMMANNVGIGNTSPSVALDVTGAFAVSGNTTLGGSLTLGSSTAVSSILDEDGLTSNSATALATQQSIKAYVDANAGSGTVDTTGTVNADEFPQFTDSNTLQALTATQMRSALNVDDGADNYGQWNLSVERNDGGISTGGIQSGGTARWAAGEGLDIEKSGAVITYSAEDATSSNKGIASFSTDNFAVSSGAVTIKDGGIANAELANSTISGVALGSNMGLNNLSDVTYSSGDLTISSLDKIVASGALDINVADGSGNDLTLKGGDDVILSANANGQLGAVVFHDQTTERIKFRLDVTPEMDVTGDFRIDGTGDITLDCASGSDIIILENNGTYTPTSDNHVATKKYVDDNTGGGGSSIGGSGATNRLAFWSDSTTLSSDADMTWDSSLGILKLSHDVAQTQLELESTVSTATSGPRMTFYRNSSSPDDGDTLARLIFKGNTNLNANTNIVAGNAVYADIIGKANTAIEGQTDGQLIFRATVNGSDNDEIMKVGANSSSGREVIPGDDNETNLGNSSDGWKGVYARTYYGYDTSTSGYLAGASESPSVVYNMGSEQLFITTDGGIVTDLRAASTSDENLKENITANTTGLSFINQLTPKNFTWKQSYADHNRMKENPERIGYLAQDVEKISSDYVEKIDYKEDDKEFLGLTDKFRNDLIAAQINAIKELSAKNDALEAKNDALEARIAALEAK